MNIPYAGVFVIDMTDWMVLAGTDSKYPEELKALGGMMKPGDKSIRATAYRELAEEGQTQVLESTLVFVEPYKGHLRHFFLADKISSALDKGATWEVEERGADGRVVEKITARWVPLSEFVHRLFPKQHPAFGAVLAKLSERNPGLIRSERFRALLQRFPAPNNLGLQGAQVD